MSFKTGFKNVASKTGSAFVAAGKVAAEVIEASAAAERDRQHRALEDARRAAELQDELHQIHRRHAGSNDFLSLLSLVGDEPTAPVSVVPWSETNPGHLITCRSCYKQHCIKCGEYARLSSVFCWKCS